MNQQAQIVPADVLPPQMGLFRERWEFFKRNRMAHASSAFLAALMVLAILGKVLTGYIVVFDPRVVRLSEKFIPPRR